MVWKIEITNHDHMFIRMGKYYDINSFSSWCWSTIRLGVWCTSYIEAWTKRLPCCRQHFQMPYIEDMFLYFDSNLTEVCLRSQSNIGHHCFGSCYGLPLLGTKPMLGAKQGASHCMSQAIAWAIDNIVYWYRKCMTRRQWVHSFP